MEFQQTRQNRFTISGPPSTASSRSASPAPSLSGFHDSTQNEKHHDHYDSSPGRHSTDVYDKTLPRWRALVRRRLVASVEKESVILAKLQNVIRTPLLDSYFVYTSLLGTHTFFMILLPAFAFFGHVDIARGLIMVLAAGVYLCSLFKDSFCSPRPFAPPVVRLTIGSHHLEYGFPSTHSTNGVSMALFFFAIAHHLAYTQSNSSLNPFNEIITNATTTVSSIHNAPPPPSISLQTFTIITIVLIFYTFSIVFGRLYTGMHSFTDCLMGTILGTGIWWGHGSWSGHPVLLSLSNPLSVLCSTLGLGQVIDEQHMVLYVGQGLGAGKWVENWAAHGGWEVPFILIPLCLLAVNQHPQPVDDCPCFEDAIAFGSVVLGALVGRWAMSTAGFGVGQNGPSIMPGSGWVLDAAGEWMQVERNWGDVGLWWGTAAVKMTVGILTIFVWRIIAKSTLHLILPPTFRLLSKLFRLPARRFYTPATEYKNVPSEFHVGEDGTIELHAIPSVIDLPSSAGVMVETGGIGSGVNGSSHLSFRSVRPDHEMKMRPVNPLTHPTGLAKQKPTVMATSNGHPVWFTKANEDQENKPKAAVKHYDADVLTKVIVYAGIAFLACEVLPLLFEVLGWGLVSRP